MTRRDQYKDPRGGHIRIYWDILDSNAWRVLSHADVRIYIALRRKLLSSNNGNINATLREMQHSGISSSSTLSVALQRLEALGFIEKTRQGGIAYGGKFCSLYRFTDMPTFDVPKIGLKATVATNEWRNFKTIAEAKVAIRHLSRKNKSKVRSSNQIASTIESKQTNSDSIVEEIGESLQRQSKL